MSKELPFQPLAHTHIEPGIMDVDEKNPYIPFLGRIHLTLLSTSLQEKLSCLDNEEEKPFPNIIKN